MINCRLPFDLASGGRESRMTSLELARSAAAALEDKKGLRIRLVRIDEISSLADYFVFATGTSNTHVRALADGVEEAFEKLGVPLYGREGYGSDSWTLLDYANVVIHIFTPEAREYFDLDRLWSDGETVPYEKEGNDTV